MARTLPPNPIPYSRVMPSAQVRFRKRYTVLMTNAAERIGAVVLRSSEEDGIVPVERAGAVAGEAVAVLDGVFLGDGGREVVRPDGTPRSPYARVLLEEIGVMVYQIVLAHQKFLRKRLPGDVRFWMERSAVSEMGIGRRTMRELTVDQLMERFPELSRGNAQKASRLRLFDPNPLAEYEAPHTWVDPSGYRLSDRIWRVDQRTRQQLDAMLIDGISQGLSAVDIARLATRYLIPGREKVQTNKPYGTDMSYDAMRLARTEIAAAANNAALISARRNPYVDLIEVVRSSNGDATCPICPQHATIGISGERLREPYSVETPPADIAPYHPHCMCHIRSVLNQDVQSVEDDLRATLAASREANLTPYVSPVEAEQFTKNLLGDVLWNIVRQTLPIQPPLL